MIIAVIVGLLLSTAEVPSTPTGVVFSTLIIIIIIAFIVIEIISDVQERRGECPAIMLHYY